MRRRRASHVPQRRPRRGGSSALGLGACRFDLRPQLRRHRRQESTLDSLNHGRLVAAPPCLGDAPLDLLPRPAREPRVPEGALDSRAPGSTCPRAPQPRRRVARCPPTPPGPTTGCAASAPWRAPSWGPPWWGPAASWSCPWDHHAYVCVHVNDAFVTHSVIRAGRASKENGSRSLACVRTRTYISRGGRDP